MKYFIMFSEYCTKRTGYMRIKDLREDHDLTQQELADYLHIKQNTYSQYETERRQIPINVLIQLAQYYDTSVDYLLGLTNETRAYPRC